MITPRPLSGLLGPQTYPQNPVLPPVSKGLLNLQQNGFGGFMLMPPHPPPHPAISPQDRLRMRQELMDDLDFLRQLPQP